MDATNDNRTTRKMLEDSLVLDKCIATCDRIAAFAPQIDELRDDIAALIAEIQARFPQTAKATRHG